MVEYTLNSAEFTSSVSWTFEEDPPLYCFVLGDIQRKTSGNTFVVWGTSGQISEVDPDGEKLWQMNFELGSLFAYTEQVDSLP